MRNDAVNRVNLHSGIQALAQSGGGVFFVVYLVQAGVAVPLSLATMAAIITVRFFLRPAILPLAIRWGLKPLLIAGTLGLALQYPLLARVHGVGPDLAALALVTAIGEILYWPNYNAYFAAIGDDEHRGHQVSAREALVAVAGILAPLAGGWALVTFGPRPMFAAVGLIQLLAAAPLIGIPNVKIQKTSAPGLLRTARIGMVLASTDAWFDASFFFVWQIALFATLGRNFSSYGGAMALAGLVGAACGLVLGRHIDGGGGRRATAIAYTLAAAVVIARSASAGSPWLAVGANAAGAFVMTLISPVIGAAIYPLAKAAPCPLRFQIFTEAAWDIGCIGGCLASAGLIAWRAPLNLTMLLSLPALLATALTLRRTYAGFAENRQIRAR
ncbi:MAG TPA: MFS transporter [Caulobacteraceae bacterium]